MSSAESRFIELYDRYRRRVANYCGRRVAADKVDDVVAETFMAVWRRIDDVPEGDSALSWLYGVAYKVVGHQWRSSSRRVKLNERLTSMGRTPVVLTDEIVLIREENRVALEAVKTLRSIDREILMLAGWEELPHGDIAAILGISIDAVRHRLQKARQRLAREYNRREPSVVGLPRKDSI